MNTITHGLLAAAILTRRRSPRRNMAAVLGALIPDLYIFGIWIWAKLSGIAEADLWRRIYFMEPAQAMGAVFNSAPLYALLLAIGFMLGPLWLWVFAAAALLHLALDFPVHVSDAHAHFWPFTDWRFESPVSYWDRSLHADWVNVIEIALVVTCAVILIRRFPALWVRILVILSALAWVTPFIYFRLVL